MPLFDYQCKKCKQISEYIVKTGQTRGLKCKGCGSGALTKILGAANVCANPNRKEPPQHTYKRNPIYD